MSDWGRHLVIPALIITAATLLLALNRISSDTALVYLTMAGAWGGIAVVGSGRDPKR